MKRLYSSRQSQHLCTTLRQWLHCRQMQVPLPTAARLHPSNTQIPNHRHLPTVPAALAHAHHLQRGPNSRNGSCPTGADEKEMPATVKDKQQCLQIIKKVTKGGPTRTTEGGNARTIEGARQSNNVKQPHLLLDLVEPTNNVRP